jgi:hypothetical protein
MTFRTAPLDYARASSLLDVRLKLPARAVQRGLEVFRAGLRQGSSHAEARVIGPAYYEHPNYVPPRGRAYDLSEASQVTASPLIAAAQ